MAVNNSLQSRSGGKPKFSVAIQTPMYQKLVNDTLGDPDRARRSLRRSGPTIFRYRWRSSGCGSSTDSIPSRPPTTCLSRCAYAGASTSPPCARQLSMCLVDTKSFARSIRRHRMARYR